MSAPAITTTPTAAATGRTQRRRLFVGLRTRFGIRDVDDTRSEAGYELGALPLLPVCRGEVDCVAAAGEAADCGTVEAAERRSSAAAADFFNASS